MGGGITYPDLVSAVEETAAAIRQTTRLLPAGGPQGKVFPPTYEGGKYAYEERLVDGNIMKTVLLDSVQSQANRLEQALLGACKEGRISFPLISIRFGGIKELLNLGLEELTSLDVPHRAADATILYSLLGDKEFRESAEGKALESASVRNSTALFEHSPTSLIFGQWLSHGARGGLGNKFPRSVVSEIVGYNAVEGIRVGGRIDPLPISAKIPVYTKADGEWTLDEKEKEGFNQGKKKEEDKYKAERASNIGLGNVPPSFKDKNGEKLVWGVAVHDAEQVGVLSLIAQRRLRFPVGGKESREINRAARVVLASLALCAMSLQTEQGFDLRSRCLLIPEGGAKWEVIPRDGSAPTEFSLAPSEAFGMFEKAVNEAKGFGLPWRTEPLVLTPSEKLIELIRRSIQIQTGEGIEVE